MEIFDFVNKPANQAVRWFDEQEKSGFVENVNFYSLGVFATNNAKNEKLPESERLAWAELSDRAYIQYEKSLPDLEKGATELSRMNLRACMILALGGRPGHGFLDVNIILNWLFGAVDEIGLSNIEFYLPWHEKDISKDLMLKLRTIKNRLNVCELVCNEDIVNKDKLEYLLAIKKSLP